MSKKYDELKDVLAGLTEKRKRLVMGKVKLNTRLNDELKKMNIELEQMSIDELAVKRTIDVISNLGLDFGGGGRADDAGQRRSMVMGLRDSILKVLFELVSPSLKKGISHMINLTEIMGFLKTESGVNRTYSSVSGTLTLLTRDGLVARRRGSTKKSKGKKFYYKLNDTPEAVSILRNKYGLDVKSAAVELESIMNEDVVEKI